MTSLQGLRQKYGTMKDLDVHDWQTNEQRHVQVQRPGKDYEGKSLDRTGQEDVAAERRKKLQLPHTATDAQCEAAERRKRLRLPHTLPHTATEAQCVAAERRKRLHLPHTATEAQCVAAEQNGPKDVYKFSRDNFYSADNDRKVKEDYIAKPSFDIEAVKPLVESFRATVTHRPRAGTGSFACLESEPEPEPDPEPTHQTRTDANPLADASSSDV